MAAPASYIDALAEHGQRLKALADPLKTELKRLTEIAARIRKLKGMKVLKHELTATRRTCECMKDAVAHFKVATFENQAVIQGVLETVIIARKWAEECEEKLRKGGPSVREKHDVWKAFLKRAGVPLDSTTTSQLERKQKETKPGPKLSRFSVDSPTSPRKEESKILLRDLAEMSEDIHSRSRRHEEESQFESKTPFEPRVVSVVGSDPLNPYIFTCSVASNLQGFDTFEFSLDLEKDSIDTIAREFAEDFADEIIGSSPSDVAEALHGSIREALKKRPDSISIVSEAGRELLKHKWATLVQLLHLSTHELTVTSLTEVDHLVKGRQRKIIQNPYLRTMKVSLPPVQGDEKIDKNSALLSVSSSSQRNKTEEELDIGKQAASSSSSSAKTPSAPNLRDLASNVAFRYGELEPSPRYLAEARQADWETLQREWWTTGKRVLPHVLVVSGPSGVGKTDYAKFVAGTLTHLIPRFVPAYQLFFRYSDALSVSSKYVDVLLGGNKVDWRRQVVGKMGEDDDLLLKQFLPPDVVTGRHQTFLEDTFKRLYHRRNGVIVLDNVPSDKLPCLLDSVIWPKDPQARSVLIVTTRKSPTKLPRNTVVQKLAPFDPVTSCSILTSNVEHDVDEINSSNANLNRKDVATFIQENTLEVKNREGLQNAYRALVQPSGGIGQALHLLSRFALWSATMAKAKGEVLLNHIEKIAKSVETEILTEEEKILSICDLDTYSPPKSSDGKESPTTPHLSRCYAFVFARLPRVARGIFRALFVFAGSFSVDMVKEALQTNDHKAVVEGLTLLLTCGFIRDDLPLGGSGRGSHSTPLPSHVFEAKAAGAMMSATLCAESRQVAAKVIRNSIEGRRFMLTRSSWRFCYLLNRVRNLPGPHKGGHEAAKKQKLWLTHLSRNYVHLMQRVWWNTTYAYQGSHEANSAAFLEVVPPLRGRGEGLTNTHVRALNLAFVHQANIQASIIIALNLISEPVSPYLARGLSLLGVLDKKTEHNSLSRYYNIKASESGSSDNSDSEVEEDLILGDPRLQFLVPDCLHRAIFPSKLLRALFSAYVRLNAPGKYGTEVSEAKGKLNWEDLGGTQKAVAMLAARRAWGWLGMGSAYEFTAKYNEGFESYSAAFQQLKILKYIRFPVDGADLCYASWHLKCIMGLCRMSEKARGVQLSVKFLEMAKKLIEPLALENPLSSQKFALNTNSLDQTLQREQRQQKAVSLWLGMANMKIVSIVLHTKMGAFQNAIDERKEVGEICKALSDRAIFALCEADLAIADTYLRLGMWSYNFSHSVYHRSLCVFLLVFPVLFCLNIPKALHLFSETKERGGKERERKTNT